MPQAFAHGPGIKLKGPNYPFPQVLHSFLLFFFVTFITTICLPAPSHNIALSHSSSDVLICNDKKKKETGFASCKYYPEMQHIP